MLNYLDKFFYSAFHVDLKPRMKGNSVAIDCDMSLKTFLQTLKHSKQSHKCILHEIRPPRTPPA